MRKLLLLGTVLTAFSMGTAMATPHNDHDGDNHGNPPPPVVTTFEVSAAAAFAGNHGKVAGNEARSESQATGTSITGGSYVGAKGVGNQNQNAGANSALQNALSLSYIQGCSCATGPSATIAAGGAIAASGNSGEVAGNESKSSREVSFSWGYHGPQITYGPASTVSANIDSSYNVATGVFQANQNSGDNSLLQNSAAVAAATGLKGASLDLGVAVAAAGNEGEVEHNGAKSDGTINTGTINNSFSASKGVFNVNQNTGANSQLQNASSVASLKFCGCAADNLSLAVAVSGNEGGVYGNWASAENGSNNANMSNSFAGSQGVMQVSQNAGANSLLQNSVSVGVITHTTP